MTDGVPDAIIDVAEWAHDVIGAERLDWLRRLPAERRQRTDDDTLVLACHASPGSQTAGFDQHLEPVGPTILERAPAPTRGHRVRSHPPARGPRPRLEDHRHDGSAGYVFDGDPTASWALIDIADDEVGAGPPPDPASTPSPSPTRSRHAASPATCTARPR